MSKIGIIGANGNMGFKRAEAFNLIFSQEMCENKIVLCDLHKHVQKDFSYDAKYTNDYNDILKNENINKVIISTPNSLERDKIVLDTLRAGKHVLVEKPLTFRRETLTQLFEVALKHNVCLKVAYNLDYFPGFNEVKKKVKKLGNIFMFNAFYGNGWLNPDNKPQNWILNKNAAAGVEYYMGCHMLSLLWNLIPEKKILKKEILGLSVFNEHHSDTSVITIKMEDMICNIIVSWNCWQNKFELNVIGTDGIASVNSMVKYIKYGQKGEKATFALRTSGMPDVDEKVFTYENVDRSSSDLEFLDIEIQHWMNSIEQMSFDNDLEFSKNLFIHEGLSMSSEPKEIN